MVSDQFGVDFDAALRMGVPATERRPSTATHRTQQESDRDNSSDRIRALTAGSVAFRNLGRTPVISEMARGSKNFYDFAISNDSAGMGRHRPVGPLQVARSVSAPCLQEPPSLTLLHLERYCDITLPTVAC